MASKKSNKKSFRKALADPKTSHMPHTGSHLRKQRTTRQRNAVIGQKKRGKSK